ncbi:hypothetical protein [Arenimonas fontis]|uniref:Uncharacterized protein n=1 Tax=Arenimonas fontis TaxID=2608255 RepID=A0A5B2ZD28_9GAMM|nr:hypothetical protein [Arenimonas fontis]KAA2285503.1 hypothetical protein F0415_02365 [Arenimonas fontis]
MRMPPLPSLLLPVLPAIGLAGPGDGLRSPVPLAPRESVAEALTCGGPDPLYAMRVLAAEPELSAGDGVQVQADGLEGPSERIQVRFDPPAWLEVGGLRLPIHEARQSSEPASPDFRAFVHAEFRGDPATVIRALGLEPGDGHPGAIADWIRVAEREGEAGGGRCPDMVGLTVLDDGRFLLGCGWCRD